MKTRFDDDDAPELTPALARKLRPAAEVLPPELYAALPKRKRGQRGKQKAATKQLVTLRLDPEIVAFFKSGGAGWQTKLNDMLKQLVALAEKH